MAQMAASAVEDAARRLEIDEDHYRALENGTAHPSAEDIQKTVRHTDITRGAVLRWMNRDRPMAGPPPSPADILAQLREEGERARFALMMSPTVYDLTGQITDGFASGTIHLPEEFPYDLFLPHIVITDILDDVRIRPTDRLIGIAAKVRISLQALAFPKPRLQPPQLPADPKEFDMTVIIQATGIMRDGLFEGMHLESAHVESWTEVP